MLGEIVVDDQRVLAGITEIFAHRTTRIWRDVLQRCGFRGGRGDDNGVRHRAMLFELANHVVNRRRLLTDGDVDTLNASAFLIDDGIDRNRRFTGLAVADD